MGFENREHLVSVLVMSFNASAYIIDVLESIKKQTYQNIELVIADDASRDNTVALAQEWLAENQSYFTQYKICASKENRGTCRNLNEGLRNCSGSYIKPIAADDILMPDCIADCLEYCLKHQAEMVIGDALWVLEDGVTETPHLEGPMSKEAFYSFDAGKQYQILLEHNNIICTPGEFYKKEFLERFGGFDEEYDIIEDYPFWLKITKAGEAIHYLDKQVVKYRQSATSATNPEKNTAIYNVRASKASKKIFYQLRFLGLLQKKKYGLVFAGVKRYLVRDLVIALGNSRKNILCRIVRRFE